MPGRATPWQELRGLGTLPPLPSFLRLIPPLLSSLFPVLSPPPSLLLRDQGTSTPLPPLLMQDQGTILPLLLLPLLPALLLPPLLPPPMLPREQGTVPPLPLPPPLPPLPLLLLPGDHRNRQAQPQA